MAFCPGPVLGPSLYCPVRFSATYQLEYFLDRKGTISEHWAQGRTAHRRQSQRACAPGTGAHLLEPRSTAQGFARRVRRKNRSSANPCAIQGFRATKQNCGLAASQRMQ